jgi:DNA-binding protein WhiA
LPAPLVAGAVCDAAAIWRGAFLMGGTLTEPHRFPALEVVCPSLETAMALTGAARRLGITTNTKHIRDVDRVTVREPDAITALLTTIGAPDTAGTWAQHRIQRREHTPGPRRPGFDDANHTRATFAAAAAATRVQRAFLILGDQVPDNLAAVATLRMTHREVSLEALGQLMDPPMTKDAVAGRIRRLLALADTTAHRTGIPDTTTVLTPDLPPDAFPIR